MTWHKRCTFLTLTSTRHYYAYYYRENISILKTCLHDKRDKKTYYTPSGLVYHEEYTAQCTVKQIIPDMQILHVDGYSPL